MARAKKVKSLPVALTEEALLGPCLSAVDLANMRHNDARLESLKARVDAAQWKVQHAAAKGELRQLTLEAAVKADIASARAQLENAEKALSQGFETAKILAADVADRYSIDWRSACFDPETGRITSIPGETEHGDRT